MKKFDPIQIRSPYKRMEMVNKWWDIRDTVEYPDHSLEVQERIKFLQEFNSQSDNPVLLARPRFPDWNMGMEGVMKQCSLQDMVNH